MRKTLLSGPVLVVIFGCASARETVPRPPPALAAVEPPCGCRQGWLDARPAPPWEWRENKDAGCCRRAFFHLITSVYVEAVLVEAPDPGSLEASVAVFRRQMDGEGYDVLEEPAVIEDEAGRRSASLRYRGTGELGHLRGKIVFRSSKTPGTVLVFFGLWTVYNDAEALAAFDDLVRHAADLPPRE